MQKACILVALALATSPAWAQRANPGGIQPNRNDQALIEQVQKERAERTQAEMQRRYERARENCNAQRGVDCDTDRGLDEWLIQERSRAEAVLDRIAPVGAPVTGSASTGSSTR
jgi:hypothetical protein